MIADRFDQRTLANMEVALERACRALVGAGQQHDARRHIAGKILECAEGGDHTLGGLTEAGCAAASELCAAHGVRNFAHRTILARITCEPKVEFRGNPR